MIYNRKGIAMLLVISLILMLLILGGAVLMISTGHFGTSYYQIKRTRAFYAAEAAMQHVLWLLREDRIASLPYSGNLPNASNFDVNEIRDTDITLTVTDINPPSGQPGHRTDDPVGVRTIDIEVDY